MVLLVAQAVVLGEADRRPVLAQPIKASPEDKEPLTVAVAAVVREKPEIRMALSTAETVLCHLLQDQQSPVVEAVREVVGSHLLAHPVTEAAVLPVEATVTPTQEEEVPVVLAV
jgi:hypothetical protein